MELSQENTQRKFRFYWKDGKQQESSGEDVAKAFSALGYGGGALRALDYYEEISDLTLVETEV